MPFSELMAAGIQLMLMGMGIVFAFLIILVVTMNGMSRLAVLLEGEQLATDAAKVPGSADEVLISVISAAIKRYRDTH